MEQPLDPDGSVLVVAVSGDATPPHVVCEVERVDPVAEPEPPPDDQACACSNGPMGGPLGLANARACARRVSSAAIPAFRVL